MSCRFHVYIVTCRIIRLARFPYHTDLVSITTKITSMDSI
jgi:hypothetical protein